MMAASLLLGALAASAIALFARIASSLEQQSSTLAALVIAAVVSAAMGLPQYGGASAWLFPWVGASPDKGLAYANLRQPNQFATLMAIGWIASFALLARTQGTTRFWLTAAVVLLGVGNAASGSRTGLLLWLLVGAALWVWSSAPYRHETATNRGRTKNTIAWAWGAYALALIALPLWVDSDRHLLARLVGDAPDCASRLVLWSNVLHLITQKPWMGWGWGELDYAHYITRYPGERFCGLLDNAHNLPLHLAVELGVPTAALICGLMVRFAWRRKPWRERDPLRFGAWLILGAIGVHSLLEYPLWYGPFQMTALLCVWMVWRPIDSSWPRDALELPGRRARHLLQGLALLLSAAALYAAWDYHRISQLFLPPERRSALYADDPWPHAHQSWLFAGHVRFAELITTAITPANAERMAALAAQTLHFSPEPAVVERLITALRLLGRDEEADFHAGRLRDAYAHRLR